MRRLVLLSVALVATLAVAVTAYGHDVTSSLTIATHNDAGPNGYLNGKLKSSKASCEKGVTVKLRWQQTPGDPYHTIRKPVTDSQGKWRQNAPAPGEIPNGSYYAKVAANGPCPAVKSPKIKVTDGI